MKFLLGMTVLLRPSTKKRPIHKSSRIEWVLQMVLLAFKKLPFSEFPTFTGILERGSPLWFAVATEAFHDKFTEDDRWIDLRGDEFVVSEHNGIEGIAQLRNGEFGRIYCSDSKWIGADGAVFFAGKSLDALGGCLGQQSSEFIGVRGCTKAIFFEKNFCMEEVADSGRQGSEQNGHSCLSLT